MLNVTSSTKGLIFDIKKFSVNDGPGIRTTVFFKGCPLRCLWCHNPESLQGVPQLVYDPKYCIDCRRCSSSCPEQAIDWESGFRIIREKCTLCGECVKACPTDALRMIGAEWTIEELLSEIEKDRVFFDNSGGGVTFSGGEPLMQVEFLQDILIRCRENRIHSAVDTSGYAPFESFQRILEWVDLFLYDVKLMDEEEHIHYTGVSIRLILENLRRLDDLGKTIFIRIPLIPGITDREKNIQEMNRFFQSLKNVKQISLLNFHKGGQAKYAKIGIPYTLEAKQPLEEEALEAIKNRFESNRFNISLGE